MRLTSITTALTVAAFTVAPALALSVDPADGHGHGTTSHGTTGHGTTGSHPFSSAIQCDVDETSDGGFSRFVHSSHAGTYWTGGLAISDDAGVGLRINAQGLPANSFRMDVTTTSNSAFEVMYFYTVPGFPGQIFQSQSGIVYPNGLSGRITFDPVSANLPSGARWSTILADDFGGNSSGSFTDTVANVFVDNVAVTPDFRPSTEDCTSTFY